MDQMELNLAISADTLQPLEICAINMNTDDIIHEISRLLDPHHPSNIQRQREFRHIMTLITVRSLLLDRNK